MASMSFELDHLFICTPVEAPPADRLIEFGLTEGARNVHLGQGTANRRFFFANAMIELVWLHSEAEASSAVVAPTRLSERCRYWETGASPFGLCLRPSKPSEAGLPFECWEYRPPYLPEGMAFYMGVNSALIDEPMLCYLPLNHRPDRLPADRKQPLEHASGLREITAVRLTLPKDPPYSAPLRAVGELGWAKFTPGGEHLMEVCFDGGKQAKTADFRPDLPLVFTW